VDETMLNYNKNKSKNIWNKHYKDNASNRIIRFVNEVYFTKIFWHVFLKIYKKKSGKILEAGSGEGIMSSRLAKLNYDVTLLDISENALEQAKINFKKNNARGTFVRGDIFKMDFPSNSFDIVWNQGVIEHFKPPKLAIKEMIRVTKKGGYVIIFVPAKYSPLQFYYLVLKSFNLLKFWPFDDQIFYSKKLLRKHIESVTQIKPKIKRIFLSFGFSMVAYFKK
tara:strand:+ start:154 stop:822 length:669 start_codon:yes stop_codon:yes gene_type:complete